WSVTQSGNAAFALPQGTTTSSPNLIFTPPTPGTYTASLKVIDSLGGTGSATLTVVATVPGPGVVIQGAPASVLAGTTLSLTSVVTEPTGATPTTYAWIVTLNGSTYTLPIGTVTNAASFSFTPTVNGLYAITLSVTDSDGGASSTSVYLS